MKAREEQIARLRHEIDESQAKNRETSEVLAEREGQLRLANMNLQSAQKQARHHTQEVRFNPHSLVKAFSLGFLYLSSFILGV